MTVEMAFSDVSEDKFFSKIQKTESCWLWTGTDGGQGYGYLSAHGKSMRAHRFSYEFHCGPIPKGLFVCHRCDVRNCVNPDHLFLGTPRDNELDMRNKGRKAKVTWLGGVKKDIPEDLKSLLGKRHDTEIAALAGVNNKTVIRIRKELGIPAMKYGGSQITELPQEILDMLGKVSDRKLASSANVGMGVIVWARRRAGIPPSRPECSPTKKK